MNKYTAKALIVPLALSQACIRTTPARQSDPFGVNSAGFHEIKAYGRKWKHYYIERYEQRSLLQIFQGGGHDREKYVAEEWLENDEGIKKKIGSNIEVLNKNGKFQIYNPCYLIEGISHRIGMHLLEMENRLFIMVEDDAKLVTDATVHPPNENEEYTFDQKHSDGKPTIFFGELNPDQFIFRIIDYVPRVNDRELAGEEKKSFPHKMRYYFSNRKPIPTNSNN